MDALENGGNLFIVAAPSGAGKSTLVNALLKNEPTLCLSISYTTRAPRAGEKNGREYHFVSLKEFRLRRDRGEFLESAEVHGNLYGTSRLKIAEQVAQGSDVLLEIDWQGAQQMRAQFSAAVGVFILPPSIEALEARLRLRGQDTQAVITRRLLAAGSEMSHACEFEYVIINQDFPVALEHLTQIVHATRLRFRSQAVRYAQLFDQLGIAVRRDSV